MKTNLRDEGIWSGHSKGEFMEYTISGLLEFGCANDLAIVDPDGISIDYSCLRHKVEILAHQLSDWGISGGDRVGIVLPNGLEMAIIFFAVSSIATACPLNPAYTREEFEFYLEDTGAKAVIVPKDGAESARESTSEDILLISSSIDSDGNLNLFPHVDLPLKSEYKLAAPEDVALVLHTSGTTNRPKRVPLTHANLVSSVQNITESYQLTSEDITLCVMPLFHVHGIVASLLTTIGTGGTVVIPSRFDAIKFWEISKNYKISWFTAVPSMHNALVNRAKRRTVGVMKNDELRFIRSCSSSLAPTLMTDLEDLFQVPVLEAYGMTEAAHQMASNPLPPRTRKSGTVGISTGVEIAIIGDHGVMLDSENIGEIVIKGSNVVSGYESNPQANSDSYMNGWFRTGDQGFVDDHGYLTLTGRIKELINRSGEKIAPREIDEVLMSHPSVDEAVAFGVPSDVHGEDINAAVLLNSEVSTAELRQFCRSRLAVFKIPRVIHIVTEIPKTASGKLQRRMVAEHFNQS